MAAPEQITKLLQELTASGVEFITITTQDLDIVHCRSAENIARLMGVLGRIGAYFWPDPSQRRLPPRASDLAGHGQLNLQTRMGRFDVLCELSDKRGYEELFVHTEQVDLGPVLVRLLDLPTLIETKTAAGRPKDRLVIPILIATLEQRKLAQGK